MRVSSGDGLIDKTRSKSFQISLLVHLPLFPQIPRKPAKIIAAEDHSTAAFVFPFFGPQRIEDATNAMRQGEPLELDQADLRLLNRI